MSDQTLRQRLARLAHENPKLRPELLAMFKQADFDALTNTANAVAALTFASGQLLNLGLEAEALLVTKVKIKVLKMDPSMRAEAAAVAREMQNRYGK